MPIKMNCPSCGKPLAAPDSAVGKRAKCPGCGQVMVVSAPAAEVDEIEVAPISEPAAASGDNWMDGLGGATQARRPRRRRAARRGGHALNAAK